MKIRQVIKDAKGVHVSWFGKVIISSDKVITNTYATELEAVRSYLTQKLSVIKGELWNNNLYGLPLLDKLDKTALDMSILQMVYACKDVVNVENFTSKVEGNTYSCSMTIVTNFGSLQYTL